MTTTSEKPFLNEVLEVDPDHYKKEDVYEFSNDRVFKSTDDGTSGIYGTH